MKLPKIKKLNAKGVSHHILIAVLVIAGIAGFGGWRVYSSSAATPASICGAGYQVVKQGRLSTSERSYPAVTYILKNTNKKMACAVMMSTGSAYGVSKKMSLKIYIASHYGDVVRSGGSDSGSFKYYAGPVYVSYAGSGWNGTAHIGQGYNKISAKSTAYGVTTINSSW